LTLTIAMVFFPFRGISPILQWLVIAIILLQLVAAGPTCPFPKPGCKMSDLSTFFAEFAAFLLSSNPPRMLPQGLTLFATSLSLMDSRVRLAWLGWVARTATQNVNCFDIAENAFRKLIINAIRSPNDIMDATQRFQALVCHSCADIPAFIVTFQNALSELTTLGAAFPDGLLLVSFFIGMLPVSVRAQMVARNHQTIKPALTDTATHAQAPAAPARPPADPMQLGHLDDSEEAGAPEPAAAGVARAAEQLLNAIAQSIATLVRPQAATGATGGRPPCHLTPEERQRRVDGNLCLYCGQHRQGTFCEADAAKKKACLQKPGNV
jgi:hypothetical protein